MVMRVRVFAFWNWRFFVMSALTAWFEAHVWDARGWRVLVTPLLAKLKDTHVRSSRAYIKAARRLRFEMACRKLVQAYVKKACAKLQVDES